MDPNVLFTGLRFDQKKFSAVIQRFKRKAGELPQGENLRFTGGKSFIECSSDDSDVAEVRTPEAKSGRRSKKRKEASDGSPASAFNLFRPPGSLNTVETSVSGHESGEREVTSGRFAEAVNVLRKRWRLYVSGQNVPPPLTSFEDLKSQYPPQKYLLRNIDASGFAEPTPIQRQAIPTLLAGRECLACAQTGSGKTLAFILPILLNLKAPSDAGIRAVILCPIRELAIQTARVFRRIAKGRKWRIRSLTRSMCLDPDVKNLPIDVLVSTPLRLAKLLKKKRISLSRVEFLVLDEADKLFEMGFVNQIDSIVDGCSNPKVIRALFSATLPDSVEELARTIMVDPVRIVVGLKNSAASTVDQRLVYVGNEDGKFLALKQLFKESLKPPILLFVDTKERAKELHKDLVVDGVSVDSIHAGRSQFQRDAAVEKFREGKTWILIATDLMARGMDFQGVNCVINYDFPDSNATYIHRIGRTGRAGRQGQAITFHTEKDKSQLRSIAHIIKSSGGEVPEWMLKLPKNMKTSYRRKFVRRRTGEEEDI
ncbi:hypothetical protein R1flu_025103 [Riccia fluitans]|uniref:RNA helicase n=1 Tax=Riccia fluitans TaxID=41844 RepID=A0ABD1XZS8_9MARC